MGKHRESGSVICVVQWHMGKRSTLCGITGGSLGEAVAGVSAVLFSAKSVQSCLFVTPWTVAHQSPLFMGFSKQEYWE